VSTHAGERGGGEGGDGGGGGGKGGDGGGEGGPRQMDTSVSRIVAPGEIILTVTKLFAPEATGNGPGSGTVAPMHETTNGPAVAGAVTTPSEPGPHLSAPGPVSPKKAPSHTWNVFRSPWY
jgi:hypothetical protein